MKFLAIFIMLFVSPYLFAPDVCETWFLKSGSKSETKECELNCAIIKTDPISSPQVIVPPKYV